MTKANTHKQRKPFLNFELHLYKSSSMPLPFNFNIAMNLDSSFFFFFFRSLQETNAFSFRLSFFTGIMTHDYLRPFPTSTNLVKTVGKIRAFPPPPITMLIFHCLQNQDPFIDSWHVSTLSGGKGGAKKATKEDQTLLI